MFRNFIRLSDAMSSTEETEDLGTDFSESLAEPTVFFCTKLWVQRILLNPLHRRRS